MKRLKFTVWDAVLPAVLLAAALVIFLAGRGKETGTAVIIADGETVAEINLAGAEDRTLVFGEVTVEVRDGKIAIVDSDCAGRDCVRTGFISSVGEMTVCLPEKTLIRITGNGGPDAVSY